MAIIAAARALSEAFDHVFTSGGIGPTHDDITADAIALESIFGNLITNAINYSPDGGRIMVKIDLAGINIRVQVQNDFIFTCQTNGAIRQTNFAFLYGGSRSSAGIGNIAGADRAEQSSSERVITK